MADQTVHPSLLQNSSSPRPASSCAVSTSSCSSTPLDDPASDRPLPSNPIRHAPANRSGPWTGSDTVPSTSPDSPVDRPASLSSDSASDSESACSSFTHRPLRSYGACNDSGYHSLPSVSSRSPSPSSSLSTSSDRANPLIDFDAPEQSLSAAARFNYDATDAEEWEEYVVDIYGDEQHVDEMSVLLPGRARGWTPEGFERYESEAHRERHSLCFITALLLSLSVTLGLIACMIWVMAQGGGGYSHGHQHGHGGGRGRLHHGLG